LSKSGEFISVEFTNDHGEVEEVIIQGPASKVTV